MTDDVEVLEADATVVDVDAVLDEKIEALEQRLAGTPVPVGLIQTDARVETLIESVWPSGSEGRAQFETFARVRLYQLLERVWNDLSGPRLLLPGAQPPQTPA